MKFLKSLLQEPWTMDHTIGLLLALAAVCALLVVALVCAIVFIHVGAMAGTIVSLIATGMISFFVATVLM